MFFQLSVPHIINSMKATNDNLCPPVLAVREGLCLRLLEAEHAPALFELTLQNKAYLSRSLPWPEEVTRLEDSVTFIERMRISATYEKEYAYGIWRDDTLIGVLSLRTGFTKKVELGYWLAEAAQGAGIMYTCVHAMLLHLSQKTPHSFCFLFILRENKKSLALAQRLGFLPLGVLPRAQQLHGKLHDECVYVKNIEQAVHKDLSFKPYSTQPCSTSAQQS